MAALRHRRWDAFFATLGSLNAAVEPGGGRGSRFFSWSPLDAQHHSRARTLGEERRLGDRGKGYGSTAPRDLQAYDMLGRRSEVAHHHHLALEVGQLRERRGYFFFPPPSSVLRCSLIASRAALLIPSGRSPLPLAASGR